MGGHGGLARPTIRVTGPRFWYGDLMRPSIPFALALTFAACGGGAETTDHSAEPTGGGEAAGPTFADEIQLICDAPDAIAADLESTSPESRSRLLADHIAGQIQTQQAVDLFGELANVPATERGTVLREAEGAPEPCALADFYDATAEPPAPATEGEGEADDPEEPVDPGGATGGGREPAVVARVIRRHINEVRYCYERQLVQEPDLEGNIDVRFTIAADGTVNSVVVTTGMHAEVDGCVKGRVESWTFPESDGVTVVNYPFVFAHTQD